MEDWDFRDVICMSNRVREFRGTPKHDKAIAESYVQETPELAIQVLSEWPEIVDILIEEGSEFRDWLDSVKDLDETCEDTRCSLVEYALKGSRCDLIERWCKPSTKDRKNIWFREYRKEVDWLSLVSVLPLLLDVEMPDNNSLKSIIAHTQMWPLLIPTLTKLTTLVDCTPAPISLEFLRFVRSNVGDHLTKDADLIIRELVHLPIGKELVEFLQFAHGNESEDPNLVAHELAHQPINEALPEFAGLGLSTETPFGTIGKLLEIKKLPDDHIEPLPKNWSDARKFTAGKPTDSLLFWLLHDQNGSLMDCILRELKEPRPPKEA